MLSAALVSSVVLGVGWHDFTRSGYTPDEEFTEFAVRGIAATGLPLLPSGLLYDRGLAYSYAASLTRTLFGDGLAPARVLSFVCALLALIALWCAGPRVARHAAAWIAVFLVAASMPFWTVATTARFYAPFLASYLATLAVLASMGPSSTRRALPVGTALMLFALAAVCRWTHELAFTLAAIPVMCLVSAARSERARWIVSTSAIVAGLIVAQAGIFALHFLAPQSGETMIRRFFLWQVLNLFEQPPLAAPLGVVLIVSLVALVVRPTLFTRRPMPGIARAWLMLVIVAALWAAAEGFRDALTYPLDLFAHIARTMPALTMATLGLLVARACGLGGAWTPSERAAHLVWLGWVVFFGVIDSGITINYLLAPVTLMLAAVAIDLSAVVRHQRRDRMILAAVTATLIASAIVATMWGLNPQAQLAGARPTIDVPNPQQLREVVATAPIVACTDELACLLLVNRVDRWLALDDFLRERFVVSKRDGDVGVYAGTPVAYRLADLFTPTTIGPAPTRVLVIDVFKDLPVGNSSTFLLRESIVDRIPIVTRLETPQLRVVELATPASAALTCHPTVAEK